MGSNSVRGTVLSWRYSAKCDMPHYLYIWGDSLLGKIGDDGPYKVKRYKNWVSSAANKYHGVLL